MSTPTIIRTQDGLEISTPYNKEFVDTLKETIPYNKRTWVKPNWIIKDKDLEMTVIGLILVFYGILPRIIDRQNDARKRIRKTIRVEYLGRCKPRDSRDTGKNDLQNTAASAWVDGSWSVIVLESALREHFAGNKEKKTQTYYTILGVSNEATDSEIKKAYRRAARQWHPDVNGGDKEAEEMFKKINKANSVLSDPTKRKKYDFILGVTDDLESDKDRMSDWMKDLNDYKNSMYGYSPPILCGILEVEGEIVAGRLVVDKILSWEDITDDTGRTMVVTWIYGDKTFTVHWV